MKPSPFDYHRPSTVEGALLLLSEHGYDASVLAGGQSLVPVLSMRIAHPEHVLDLNAIPGLDAITVENGTLVIGAMTRQRSALESKIVSDECPLLTAALTHVGHPETRNRGTIGGSIVHNDPAAEIGAVAMACDAEIVLRSSTGTRTEAVADFLIAPYMTAKRPDELVVEIRLPRTSAAWGWAFEELARRHHDFALVGVGVGIELVEGAIADARLAYAGAGATALRSRAAEEVMRGALPSPELFAEADRVAASEIDPPTDVLASSDYRRHVATVLTKRALATATARAKGERS
jgi:CO/xanthine dehydrogenase FAD-binding subunit